MSNRVSGPGHLTYEQHPAVWLAERRRDARLTLRELSRLSSIPAGRLQQYESAAQLIPKADREWLEKVLPKHRARKTPVRIGDAVVLPLRSGFLVTSAIQGGLPKQRVFKTYHEALEYAKQPTEVNNGC